MRAGETERDEQTDRDKQSHTERGGGGEGRER